MGGGIILGMLLGINYYVEAIPVPRVWSDNNHHRPYHLLYGSIISTQPSGFT